jgi:CRP/FNR family transcriptional regulator, anaerobic regulatory protein
MKVYDMTILQGIYAHPHIDPAGMKTIIDAHEYHKISKGSYLLRKGQVADEYVCLEHGLIRSWVHDYNGNEITMNFYSSGEIAIDEISLFHRLPTRGNMQALTDCTAWRIDFQSFQQLFTSVGGLPEWGRTWMSQRLFECRERSVSMITESARTRYLALQHHHPDILQYAPLKYIASYLGITDSSLSRIRKDLANIHH